MQKQKVFYSLLLTLPNGFHKINPSRMCTAPVVVIQKFNGDLVEYWLFVRQFGAPVLGKFEDYKLFLLLYQYCKSHVQFKFSYVSNQLPVITF